MVDLGNIFEKCIVPKKTKGLPLKLCCICDGKQERVSAYTQLIGTKFSSKVSLKKLCSNCRKKLLLSNENWHESSSKKTKKNDDCNIYTTQKVVQKIIR